MIKLRLAENLASDYSDFRDEVLKVAEFGGFVCGAGFGAGL